MKKHIRDLKRLVIKLEDAAVKFQSAQDAIIQKIEDISGISGIVGSYFPDDGMGLAIGDAADSYAGLAELIQALEANGTITKEDLNNTFF